MNHHSKQSPTAHTATMTADATSALAAQGPGLLLVFDGQRLVRRALALPTSTRQEFQVGRDTTCALHINDARVSRHHASVRRTEHGVSVKDHHSRNGTFLYGERLTPEIWVDAPPQAVLRFGRSLCLVVNHLAEASSPFQQEHLLWGGGKIQSVLREIAAVAQSDLHVLLQGATGTGKELAARSIHQASGRQGSFVTVNCGALPGELIVSELFGHARGAFSGAERRRAGLITKAKGGTIFLDEVAELTPAAQASLLRFLDHGEVRSLGDDAPQHLDVRVLSATHRDLTALVQAGHFRVDLFHRLAAYQVTLPSLHDRREDIAELAWRFADKHQCRLDALTLEPLLGADWSGAVRQLKSTVEAACIRTKAAGRDLLMITDLPPLLPTPTPSTKPSPPPPRAPLERATIEAALRSCQGRVAQAARHLGYSRSGFYSAMERCGLRPEDYR